MRLRLPALALLCFTAFGGIAAAQNAFPDILDTTKLPRLPGARELYAFPHTSSFVVSDSVADAAEVVVKGLAADGWQEYGPPFSERLRQPTSQILTFKRGWQALSVYITLAPAQGGATAVAYTAIAIENDLPFPKDATDIKFAPDRPHLNLFTAESVEVTHAFFAKELGGMGWSPWSTKDNAKKDPGEIVSDPTPRGALAYFVKDGKQSMVLVLQRTNDGRTMVELKAFPLNMMNAGGTAANDTVQSRGSTIPNGVAQERKQALQDARSGLREIAREAQAIRAEIAELRADMKMIEPADLPRLPGAKEDSSRSSQERMSYTVDGPLDATVAALRKLLAQNGWTMFAEPLQQPNRHIGDFIRGRQRLHVFYTMPGARTDITGINYSLSRLHIAVPLPEGATDVLFDDRRPYLNTMATGSVDATIEMYRRELVAAGWSAWSAADTARYPNATIEETVENGARVYFARERRDGIDPIQVTAKRRADGRTDVEVRVPAFARRQDLSAGSDIYGMPKPEQFKGASGRDGQTQRKLTAYIPAETPAVLAFYRREMSKRGWTEDAGSATVKDGETTLTFSSANGPAQLRLGTRYDLTSVELVHQLPPREVAAKAKARRDAEEKLAKQVEEFTRAPAAKLEAMMGLASAPIPLPDTAINPNLGGGEVKFDSPSSPQEIAAFYRGALKPLSFREIPTPIDNANMVALDFSRSGKRMHITIMRMGAKTNVRAYGEALVALSGSTKAATPQVKTAIVPEVKTASAPAPEVQALEAEEKDGLPVPKPNTEQGITKTKFRIESQTTVSAPVATVLSFYRDELKKRDWKEDTGAQITTDRAVVAFTTSEGPARLNITRDGGKTNALLVLRKPADAEKAGIKPKPGLAKVMLGSIMDTETSVTIDKRTFKLAPNAGQKNPDGPALDLAPGTYKYTVKVPGKPAFNEEVKVSVDEAWGVLVGPGGGLSLQVY